MKEIDEIIEKLTELRVKLKREGKDELEQKAYEIDADLCKLSEVLNDGVLANVISNDKHLESINDIMWDTCMVKGRAFGRKEGFKIMQVLEEWTTPK